VNTIELAGKLSQVEEWLIKHRAELSRVQGWRATEKDPARAEQYDKQIEAVKYTISQLELAQTMASRVLKSRRAKN
jgi:hypothetical protein